MSSVQGFISIPLVQNGEAGKGIVSITNYYALSDSRTESPDKSLFTTAIPTMTAEQRYLWNFERTLWSDGTMTDTVPMVKAMYSEDGRGLLSFTEYYLATATSAVPTTDMSEGWTEDIPSVSTTLPYLWNFERMEWTDGSTTDTAPHLIGKYGESIQPNILRQTMFIEGKMDEWIADTTTGSYAIDENSLDGRNAVVFTANASNYYSLLQYVTDRVSPSTVYTLSFYALSDDIFSIHLHNMVDTVINVDTHDISYRASGNAVFFMANAVYTRYSVTFQTPASFSGALAVYFRAYGANYSTVLGTTSKQSGLYVSMPKLERSSEATAYIPNESELQGDPGADGQSAVSIIASPENVVFSASVNNVPVQVSVYKGDEKIELTSSNLGIMHDVPDGVRAVRYTTDTLTGFRFIRSDSSVDVSGTCYFYVIVDEQEYPCYLNLYTLHNGITFSVTGEQVLFGPDTGNCYVEVHAYRDGVELEVTKDMLTEYKGTISNLNGGYQGNNGYWFERDDNDIAVDTDWDYYITIDGIAYPRTVVFRTIKNGLDCVSVTADTDFIAFKANDEDDDAKTITIEAYKGSTKIELTADNLSDLNTTKYLFNAYAVWSKHTNEDGTAGYLIERLLAGESQNIKGSVDYSVTIDDVVYSKTLHVATLYDGIGTVYRADVDTASILYNAFGEAYAPSSVTFTCYKTEGTATSTQTAYWIVYFNYSTSSGTSDTYTMANVSGSHCSVNISNAIASKGYLTSIYAEAYSDSDRSSLLATSAEIQVSTTCAIRYQKWHDVDDGFSFESGKIGEKYIDFVLYDPTGKYTSKNSESCYYCKNSHTKSSATAPTTGSSTDPYWTAVNSFDSIATNLLLAGTAKIDNLYVDDIFMVTDDGATAIWMHPSIGGFKVLKASNLSSLARADQESETSWDNPTAWFHGGDLRTIEEVYTVDSASSGSASSSLLNFANVSLVDKIDTQETTLATVAMFPAGCTMVLEFDDFDISLTEGSVSSNTTDVALAFSSINYKITVQNSGGGVLATLLDETMFGTGIAGDVTESTIFGKTVSYTNSSTLSYSLSVVLTVTYYLRGSGGAITTSTINVSYNTITLAYVSENAANGFFYGHSSVNFFRAAIDDGSMNFRLVAGNYGIDVSQSGLMQKENGKWGPLGNSLMLLHAMPNGSTVIYKCLTFDGSKPSITYKSTGTHTVHLPSSWASTLGSLSADKLCITGTITHENAVGMAMVWYSSSSDGSGDVQILTTNNGGVLKDFGFYVRIDYMGGAQTLQASIGGTTS